MRRPSLSDFAILNLTFFLLLFLANVNRSKGFVSTIPLWKLHHEAVQLPSDNSIVVAAKGKKIKKKKRPSSSGGGFGTSGKSPSPPKQEEDTGAAAEANKQQKKRATASHILIKDDNPKAEAMLRDIKAEVGDDPDRFAHYASQYSECGSRMQGGSLGEFGLGQMAKEFEEVVFNEEVEKVHGPVRTQFGYHLIYISERSDPENKMEKYFKNLL